MMSFGRITLVADFEPILDGWLIKFSAVAANGERALCERSARRSDLDALGLRELSALPPDRIRKELAGAHAIELGERLSTFLFGSDGEQAELFGRLLGDNGALGKPNVLSAGDGIEGCVLELRASVEEVLIQPWHLLAYRGRRLVANRWEIYCARPGGRVATLEMTMPPTTLLVVPELERALRAEEHIEEIKARLRHFGATHIGLARSLEELRAEASKRWQLVYYYGHGRPGADGIPEFLLGGANVDALSLSRFAPLVDAMAPTVVYLNACQVGAGGWYGAGHQLAASGRLVLSHFCSISASYARDRANKFFGRLLSGRYSPLASFLPTPSDLADDNLEWLFGAAQTNSREWRFSGAPAPAVPDDVWALRLDRQPQRDRVYTAVNRDLTKQPSLLRGVAFVGIGSEASRAGLHPEGTIRFSGSWDQGLVR
jgi:hypothetical protein